MMISSRRFLCLALAISPSRAFVSTGPQQVRSLVSRTAPLSMAAQGVVLTPTDEIKKALENPDTVILDARRVEEIEASGYWNNTDRQWVHAPCFPDGTCPLLNVAAESLLRDKDAPVIVYCASGIRSTVAKNFLQGRGYTNVLNAGGFPGDFAELM